jgi:hypothetical protein
MNIIQPRCRAYVAALGVVCLVGCQGRQSSSTSDTAREIENVRRQTVPDDGSMLGSSKPIRKDSSVRATWEVQTAGDAQTYFGWLKDHVGSQYQVTSEKPSAITFVKHLDGDSYTVEIRSASSPTKTFDISFIAGPD